MADAAKAAAQRTAACDIARCTLGLRKPKTLNPKPGTRNPRSLTLNEGQGSHTLRVKDHIARHLMST
jgi:hypothetical protein